MSHPSPTDQQWLLLHEIDVNPSALSWEPGTKQWMLKHGGTKRVVTGQVKRLRQLGYVCITGTEGMAGYVQPCWMVSVEPDGKEVLQRRELIDVINRVNGRSK